MIIRPGITEEGFRTAVRDYTEYTVVEELAANSYDADASVVVVLLDPESGKLFVIDDGIGFSEDTFYGIATLGSGDKNIEIPYSKGKRHYLGSYGYGLKSTLNIATKVEIVSISKEESFTVTIDWSKLREALEPGFKGFPFNVEKGNYNSHGTIITLHLKSPTPANYLDRFSEVLANIPSDGGKFICFCGLLSDTAIKLPVSIKSLKNLREKANELHSKGILKSAGSTFLADLSSCKVIETNDKEDRAVKTTIYFAGLQNDKVKQIKPGLRGIYIRIHGRLLKQSFTDSDFTYGISKWKKFESGLRVELSIDWLRGQISLAREGITFSNEKLENDFIKILTRNISSFIYQQLKIIKRRKSRELEKKQKQRDELAEKRIKKNKGITINFLSEGFVYHPETDGELALLISQPTVIKKILKNYKLIDYNDQAPFDCYLYNEGRRELVKTELEPRLTAFLEHQEKDGIQLIITWTRTNWRIGAKKKGKGGYFELIADENKRNGWYKLLEYSTKNSKKPRRDYMVIVLDEIINT